MEIFICVSARTKNHVMRDFKPYGVLLRPVMEPHRDSALVPVRDRGVEGTGGVDLDSQRISISSFIV